MPVPVSYPGVYIQEIPSGVRTITGVATSITTFLGRTDRGLANEPTFVNNFGEFERKFGGLSRSSAISFAVRDFFQSGGGQALIVRVYKDDPDEPGDGKARIKIGDLALEAASPGDWGNKLAVRLTQNPDQTAMEDVAVLLGLTRDKAKQIFDIEIIDFTGIPVDDIPDYRSGKKAIPAAERFRNVTVARGLDSKRPLDRILTDESALLRVDGAEGLPEATPDQFDTISDLATGGLASKPLGGSDDYLGNEKDKTGLYALEKADLFNILCIPPDDREWAVQDVMKGVYSTAAAYCARRRAMLVVDVPAAWSQAKSRAEESARAGMTGGALGPAGPDARNAAAYFPWMRQQDPLRDGKIDIFPPSGTIAGLWARTDSDRGVWKAPAGLDAALTTIKDLMVNLTDLENGRLNQLGLNCLRSFPVNGRVVWGARTLRGADQLGDEYKYIPVRRTALFIEESLYRGLQWAVFEPNDEPLWAQIRLNVGAFMNNLFRQGAFQGASPKDAYFVRCDKETTTQNDINLGIVNVIVGFAPLKPAEFVVVKLQQMAGQIQT